MRKLRTLPALHATRLPLAALSERPRSATGRARAPTPTADFTSRPTARLRHAREAPGAPRPAGRRGRDDRDGMVRRTALPDARPGRRRAARRPPEPAELRHLRRPVRDDRRALPARRDGHADRRRHDRDPVHESSSRAARRRRAAGRSSSSSRGSAGSATRSSRSARPAPARRLQRRPDARVHAGRAERGRRPPRLDAEGQLLVGRFVPGTCAVGAAACREVRRPLSARAASGTEDASGSRPAAA